MCRGTQIRVRTFVNQSVLRDDWNPSQSESSFNVLYTETLVVAHQGFSAGGGCWVSTHKLILHYVGTPQVWQVLSALEHPVLGPTVESTLVPAPFACDLFRFGLSFSSCLVSFHSKAGSFSPLLKPSLLHTLFGRLARECWSLCLRTSSYYTARTRSSQLGEVVYDVHDCFVGRHNKRNRLLLNDKHGD